MSDAKKQRRENIERALHAIRQRRDRKGGPTTASSYIRRKYRMVPVILRMLGNPDKLSAHEREQLRREELAHVLGTRTVPAPRCWELLMGYLLYLEATSGESGSDYRQQIQQLLGVSLAQQSASSS